MKQRKRIDIRADEVKPGDYDPRLGMHVRKVTPSAFMGVDMTVLTFESNEQCMWRNDRTLDIERWVPDLPLGTVADAVGASGSRVFKTASGWVNTNGGAAGYQSDDYWAEYVITNP